MAHDDKYGKVTVERGDIPEHEPVFVLRAQDILAAGTVLFYGRLRAFYYNDMEAMARCERIARVMEVWPTRKDPT